MKKRTYEEPATGVVELQQRGLLMASGTDATRSGYGTAVEESWDSGSGVKAIGNNDVWDEVW